MPTQAQLANYDNIIYNGLIAEGIRPALARLITAQARLESGHYTAANFVQNNNAFGYKHVPGNRLQIAPTRVSTEKDYYANYATLENSVKDIAGYFKRRAGLFAHVQTVADYNRVLIQIKYYTGSQTRYETILNDTIKRVDKTIKTTTTPTDGGSKKKIFGWWPFL